MAGVANYLAPGVEAARLPCVPSNAAGSRASLDILEAQSIAHYRNRHMFLCAAHTLHLVFFFEPLTGNWQQY